MAQTFIQWQINEALVPDSEFMFKENFIGIRGTSDDMKLAGQKVYRVVDTDESTNTIVLSDDEGNRYKYDQTELSKALAATLAEDSTMRGFQLLQYPLGYAMAGSATELISPLAIYDARIKKEFKIKGEVKGGKTPKITYKSAVNQDSKAAG